MPPFWQLPGAAVSSVIENTAYDARRDTVKRLVTLHEREIAAEIDRGGGPGLAEAMTAARVAVERRPALLADLRGHPGIYRLKDRADRLDIEAVTVALMVYGR